MQLLYELVDFFVSVGLQFKALEVSGTMVCTHCQTGDNVNQTPEQLYILAQGGYRIINNINEVLKRS